MARRKRRASNNRPRRRSKRGRAGAGNPTLREVAATATIPIAYEAAANIASNTTEHSEQLVTELVRRYFEEELFAAAVVDSHDRFDFTIPRATGGRAKYEVIELNGPHDFQEARILLTLDGIEKAINQLKDDCDATLVVVCKSKTESRKWADWFCEQPDRPCNISLGVIADGKYKIFDEVFC